MTKELAILLKIALILELVFSVCHVNEAAVEKMMKITINLL